VWKKVKPFDVHRLSYYLSTGAKASLMSTLPPVLRVEAAQLSVDEFKQLISAGSNSTVYCNPLDPYDPASGVFSIANLLLVTCSGSIYILKADCDNEGCGIYILVDDNGNPVKIDTRTVNNLQQTHIDQYGVEWADTGKGNYGQTVLHSLRWSPEDGKLKEVHADLTPVLDEAVREVQKIIGKVNIDYVSVNPLGAYWYNGKLHAFLLIEMPYISFDNHTLAAIQVDEQGNVAIERILVGFVARVDFEGWGILRDDGDSVVMYFVRKGTLSLCKYNEKSGCKLNGESVGAGVTCVATSSFLQDVVVREAKEGLNFSDPVAGTEDGLSLPYKRGSFDPMEGAVFPLAIGCYNFAVQKVDDNTAVYASDRLTAVIDIGSMTVKQVMPPLAIQELPYNVAPVCADVGKACLRFGLDMKVYAVYPPSNLEAKVDQNAGVLLTFTYKDDVATKYDVPAHYMAHAIEYDGYTVFTAFKGRGIPRNVWKRFVALRSDIGKVRFGYSPSFFMGLDKLYEAQVVHGVQSDVAFTEDVTGYQPEGSSTVIKLMSGSDVHVVQLPTAALITNFLVFELTGAKLAALFNDTSLTTEFKPVLYRNLSAAAITYDENGDKVIVKPSDEVPSPNFYTVTSAPCGGKEKLVPDDMLVNTIRSLPRQYVGTPIVFAGLPLSDRNMLLIVDIGDYEAPDRIIATEYYKVDVCTDDYLKVADPDLSHAFTLANGKSFGAPVIAQKLSVDPRLDKLFKEAPRFNVFGRMDDSALAYEMSANIRPFLGGNVVRVYTLRAKPAPVGSPATPVPPPVSVTVDSADEGKESESRVYRISLF